MLSHNFMVPVYLQIGQNRYRFDLSVGSAIFRDLHMLSTERKGDKEKRKKKE